MPKLPKVLDMKRGSPCQQFGTSASTTSSEPGCWPCRTAPFCKPSSTCSAPKGTPASLLSGAAASRGRNRAGGWDLEAYDCIDGDCFGCIVQVKQFASQAIYQRHVDELRGCLLRAGGREAWLITLSTFSAPARAARADRRGSGPGSAGGWGKPGGANDPAENWHLPV